MRPPPVSKTRRRRERYPELHRPEFAKLGLARLDPEPSLDPVDPNPPFKAGSRILFRLLITNTSEKDVFLPYAPAHKHNRLQLFRDGELIPYSESATKQVRLHDHEE